MGLYEGIKDVAKVVQQADNVELYKQLLDLSAQALDMQAEIAKLKEENVTLKKKKTISDKIIRHKEAYITLDGEEKELYYCSHCWDSEEITIQLIVGSNGTFECPHCHVKGIYDEEKRKQAVKRQTEALANRNARARRNSYLYPY